jgi:flagellar hook-length control protein FliK
VQSIRLQAIAGGGEAVVRLRPDYLGELVVVVKVTNGAVTAALQSDTPAVRRWVEANEATLRLGLAEHGLQLDRLTVSGDAPVAETGEREPQRDGRSPGDDESQQPESRRRRPQDPEATFEVIV